MTIKKITSVIAACLATIPTLSIVTASADAVKIGEAYIETSLGSSEKLLISSDGKYELTYKIPGNEKLTNSNINFSIHMNSAYPLGKKADFELNIEELWIDGTQIDSSLIGKSNYGGATDMYYAWGENYENYVAVAYNQLLKVSDDSEIKEVNDSIKVVFTVSNMTDTDTFVLNPISESTKDMTTTEETSTTSQVTTALEETTTDIQQTTISKDTTTNQTTSANIVSAVKNNDSPKTGDKGIVNIAVATILAGAAMFPLRKRGSNEENI